jgi:hypothetical protein
VSTQSRQTRPERRPPTTATMTLEDLFLLDDLRSLDIPWVDRLVRRCSSHEDVVRVWTLIRCWGPDDDEVESKPRSSTPRSGILEGAEKLRRMVRSIERWRP